MRIRRSRKAIFVTLMDADGNPLARPYAADTPALNLHARFDDFDGTLEVFLWHEKSGFTLVLSHEMGYELDDLRRESLVVAVTRYSKDDFLEQYYYLFPLKHYVREISETAA